MKLKNKVAVITGAGKGIGKATAKLFLKEGAKCVLVTRSKEDIEAINKEWKKYRNSYITMIADVSKESTIKKIVSETIKKYKHIDILVNNAGFGIFANLVDSRLEDFDAQFNTNVRALYMLTKAFLPYMIKRKSGDIVNIASIAGKNGVATASIYSATKHAVMGLTRSLMLEVRKYNIRAIAVCPGSVDTDFFRAEGLGAQKSSVLQSEDIAEAIMLAVSLPANALVHEIELRPANPQK